MQDDQTMDEIHEDHQEIAACEACQLFRLAHEALMALGPSDESLPQYLSVSEWYSAQAPVSDAQKRHETEAHPRYRARIVAAARRLTEARQELSERV